jgi:ABC-type lipoprotein export system ATPase subunit
MTVLELKNISHSFGEVNILKNAFLEIKAGELTGVFGPSGCGKSTALYIGAGMLKPQQGEIHAYGKNLDSEESIIFARKNHFGFIYQFHNLIPELTVFENVMIASIISGKKDKEFVSFLLNELGIYEKRNYAPAELSGGQAQRCAIARGFAGKPGIVFADEPTGNLDPITAKLTMELILKQAKKNQTAILFISHNQNFMKLMDKCVTIEKGSFKEVNYEKESVF